jgi:protein ImuB
MADKPARIAVVDLPDLPLQLLERAHPRWRGHPVAVVAEDRPDAPLTHVDRRAWRAGLRAGLRYGAARGLVPALRAGVVSAESLTAAVDELASSLQTFSPRVEPDERRPGVYYVDPAGLRRIYGGWRRWAEAVRAYLLGRGFRCTVVVGWGRFSTLAIARARTGSLVMRSRAQAAAVASETSLDRLGLPPRLRDELGVLGLTSLGDLSDLPAGELVLRFGQHAAELAGGVTGPEPPMHARGFCDPARATVEIEPPDADHPRLLFAAKGALDPLVERITGRSEVVSALRVELQLEPRGGTAARHVERVEPARPTRDALLLLDLVRLRLADLRLAAPVERITLETETTRADGDQLALFQLGVRDIDKGARALARVRAAFGDDSVTRARLREAHLPEASFEWQPVTSPTRPAPVPAGDRRPFVEPPPLIRRVLTRPRPLPSASRDDPAAGPDLGPSVRLFGPYRVSGGWWVRDVERDYYYAQTGTGELLWLYYDRPRRRWFEHGVVD